MKNIFVSLLCFFFC
uniref:Uncharacterized protein n=1 Tax=Rhizophora mucronata TaxID=61149 RepID=A0A2P2PCP7_RHIMU